MIFSFYFLDFNFGLTQERTALWNFEQIAKKRNSFLVRGRHLWLEKNTYMKRDLREKQKKEKSDQKTTEVVLLRKDEINSPYLWMYFKTGLKENSSLFPDLANIHVLICKQ